MRLFHVSEDPTIMIFHPRLPERPDLDAKKASMGNQRKMPAKLFNA